MYVFFSFIIYLFYLKGKGGRDFKKIVCKRSYFVLYIGYATKFTFLLCLWHGEEFARLPSLATRLLVE